jgi:hypothetical protein
MTVGASLDALEDGYPIGILHSSAAALSMYRRLGFGVYCSIGQYIWANERGPAADEGRPFLGARPRLR